MIAFTCPGCGKSFSVKDELAGKQRKCPNCATHLTVPASIPPVASAAVHCPHCRDPLTTSERQDGKCANCNKDLPLALRVHAPQPTANEPLPVATAPTILTELNTRVCEWCSESIATTALKCPRCHTWRKDIKRDRDLMYAWTLAAFLILPLLFLGLNQSWWKPDGFRDGFSWESFFKSPSGLAIVGWLLVTMFMSFVYYFSYNEKTGNQF